LARLDGYPRALGSSRLLPHGVAQHRGDRQRVEQPRPHAQSVGVQRPVAVLHVEEEEMGGGVRGEE
tara:strand:- start:476 stop:673 length:198 start_codon:yes stop_codon:yes gene_type:complete